MLPVDNIVFVYLLLLLLLLYFVVVASSNMRALNSLAIAGLIESEGIKLMQTNDFVCLKDSQIFNLKHT